MSGVPEAAERAPGGRGRLARGVAAVAGRPLREALLVGLVVLAVHPFVGPPEPYAAGSYHDDGVYLVLGKALATGQGYWSIHLAGEPVHVKYPPGLPALFALLWWLGGGLAQVLRLALALNAVAAAGAAAAIWWLGRERLGLPALAVAAFALAPLFLDATIQYYNLALSEPYYVLGWAAALVLAYRLADAEAPRARLRLAAALGLTLAAAALVRTQAAALIPAMLAALLLRRRGAGAVALAGAAAALPLIAWRLYHARLVALGPLSDAPDETSYLAWLPVDGAAGFAAFAAATVARNVLRYVVVFSHYASGQPVVGLVLLTSAAVLAAVAAARQLRTHPELVLTLAATLAVPLLWPITLDRFVVPALPFAGLLAATEVRRLLAAGGARQAMVLRAACLLWLAAIGLRQLELRAGARDDDATRLAVPGEFVPRTSALIREVSAWAAIHTTAADRLLVAAPAGVHLYTGRSTVNAAPSESDAERLLRRSPGRFVAERIVRDGVTVVVAAGPRALVARGAVALAESCPGLLHLEGPAGPRFPAYYRVEGPIDCAREVAAAAPPD